ncbi:hypothetical protein ACKGJY_15200 [Hyunsoonleella sp. 2307UL5-6]|uniref:hypothetical protein n=1 Tax=Hyunsoonleella sp. 2307UL5-6 TaxID=3384768 RepID=UPI0039BC3E39
MSDTVSENQSNVTSLDDSFKKENIIFTDDYGWVHVKTPKGTRAISIYNAIKFIEEGIEREFEGVHHVIGKQS